GRQRGSQGAAFRPQRGRGRRRVPELRREGRQHAPGRCRSAAGARGVEGARIMRLGRRERTNDKVSTVDERIAALEAEMRHEFGGVVRGLAKADELKALKFAKAVEESQQIAAREFEQKASAADEHADEAERLAAELRVRAVELHPAAEEFELADARIEAKLNRVAEFEEALESSILAAEPETSLRRIEEHLLAARHLVEEHADARRALDERVAASDRMRSAAYAADDDARAWRAKAADARAAIE